MFYLLNIEENDRSFEMYYHYVKNNTFLPKRISPILRGNTCLSELEQFKITYQMQKEWEELPSSTYLFFASGKPVGTLYVMQVEEHTYDISFHIAPTQWNKGYATAALQEIERILFQREEVHYTTITDISNAEAIQRLIKKGGYQQIDHTNRYRKGNPQYQRKELTMHR